MVKEFIVETIVDSRISSKGKKEYKVKWRGYSLSDCTWEPLSHV